MARPADELEHRETLVIGDDRLSVYHERAAGQGRNRCRGERKPRREIMTIAGEKVHAGRVAPGHDAKAVVFDFVNPVRPGRRSLSRGGQARFNKGRQTAATHTQHVQLIGTETQGVESIGDVTEYRQRGAICRSAQYARLV
jgi:cytosine/adenosine deaminase-related metal-dependent hydrolase